MTREEAIQWLEEMKDTIELYNSLSKSYTFDKFPQAIDMATEALSKPKVAYACDGRRCGADCSDCGRTTDIEHAKNFTKVCDSYFEKLQTEPSVSIQPKTIANNCDLISRYEALKAINGACEMWEDEAIVADILHHLPSADIPIPQDLTTEQWDKYIEECRLLRETLSADRPTRGRKDATEEDYNYCDDCEAVEMCMWYPYYGCQFKVSRPSGEWLDYGDKPMKKHEQYSGHCSVCGEWSEYLTNYCGNCGARMENTK